jgi:hypothetical protein
MAAMLARPAGAVNASSGVCSEARIDELRADRDSCATDGWRRLSRMADNARLLEPIPAACTFLGCFRADLA